MGVHLQRLCETLRSTFQLQMIYLEIEFTKTFFPELMRISTHLSCPTFLLVIFFGHRKTITLTPYLSEPPPSGGYVGVLNCLVLVSLVSGLIHSFNHTPRSIFRWFPAAGKIHHEIQVLIQSFQISTLGGLRAHDICSKKGRIISHLNSE